LSNTSWFVLFTLVRSFLGQGFSEFFRRPSKI